MITITFNEKEIAEMQHGLSIELENTIARRETVKRLLEKLTAESSAILVTSKEIKSGEKAVPEIVIKPKKRQNKKMNTRKMPVNIPVKDKDKDIGIELLPLIKEQTEPMLKTKQEIMPESEIQPEIEPEIQSAIEVGNLPGVKASPRNDGLDTFLYQVLQSEDRFFSLDSLLSRAFIEYKVEDEFKKEDLVKKVKKNLTVMGRKGMIEIKRPREGKRFLYKMN